MSLNTVWYSNNLKIFPFCFYFRTFVVLLLLEKRYSYVLNLLLPKIWSFVLLVFLPFVLWSDRLTLHPLWFLNSLLLYRNLLLFIWRDVSFLFIPFPNIEVFPFFSFYYSFLSSSIVLRKEILKEFNIKYKFRL